MYFSVFPRLQLNIDLSQSYWILQLDTKAHTVINKGVLLSQLKLPSHTVWQASDHSKERD